MKSPRNASMRIRVALHLTIIGLTSIAAAVAEPPAPAARLIGHWPLAQDTHDAVGMLHGKPTNVEFGRGVGSERMAAIFNGRDSMIEIPSGDALNLLSTRGLSAKSFVEKSDSSPS